MNSPEDLAEFGRSLLSDDAPEIALRTAANRLYYSAFHHCNSLASTYCGELRPEEEKDKGEHAKVLLRLAEHSRRQDLDDSLRFVAETTKKMRVIRTDADYKLEKEFRNSDAKRVGMWLRDIENRRGRIQDLVNPPNANVDPK